MIYSNVSKRGNFIYERGYDDNAMPFKRKVPFKPTYWVSTRKPSAWSTIKGEPVEAVNFDSIYEAKEFLVSNSDVANMQVFGDIGFEYQYIAQQYHGKLNVSPSIINTCYLDIETTAEHGFPDVRDPVEAITLITLKYSKSDQYITFGTLDAKLKTKTASYYQFADENTMLRAFLEYWGEHYPDVITGWNTEEFDIPYLMERLVRLVGEAAAKQMSPWGHVYSQERQVGGKKELFWKIQGIAHLDMLALYKKFTYSKQESYKLDFIGEVEVGSKKLSNPEQSFKDFYGKHPQMFVEYNVHDVELVVAIDRKLRLIDLAVSLSYLCHTTIDDAFYQTVMWDALIYNKLLDRKQVIPPRSSNTCGARFEGGFVKEPQLGVHSWVISEDLDSLYPHILMQSNISIETVIDYGDLPKELQRISDQASAENGVDLFLNDRIDLSPITKHNVSFVPNGVFFNRDHEGLFPELMRELYDNRKALKGRMLEVERKIEEAKKANASSSVIAKLQDEADALNSLQKAFKVGLNSCFGVSGNPTFRYYDLRIAEGITKYGQMTIQWAERHVNKFLNRTLKTSGVDYILYIDTDAIYVNLEPIVNKFYPGHSKLETVDMIDKFCANVLDPVIAQGYTELYKAVNARLDKMHMKREIIADKAFWVSKKRYTARVYDSEHVRFTEPHLKVMGLQIVRSDTPAVFRERLKKAIPVILDGGKAKLKDYIQEVRTEIMKMKPEEVAFPSSVSKMNKYRGDPVYKSGCPIHVRSALLHNVLLKRNDLEKKYQAIAGGERIHYLYLKMPNPIHENVIGYAGEELPPEFGLTQYVDFDTQFQKAFIKPLQGMVDGMHWNILDTDKASLEDFFG